MNQFIGGGHRTGRGEQPLTVVEPATGAVLAEMDTASPADVDDAVAAVDLVIDRARAVTLGDPLDDRHHRHRTVRLGLGRRDRVGDQRVDDGLECLVFGGALFECLVVHRELAVRG